MNKEEYQEYLKSEHWRKTRARKLEESGNCCEKCPAKHMLSVHHLTYERLWKELMTDLEVLCDVCHKTAHGIDIRTSKQYEVVTTNNPKFYGKNHKKHLTKKQRKDRKNFSQIVAVAKQRRELKEKRLKETAKNREEILNFLFGKQNMIKKTS